MDPLEAARDLLPTYARYGNVILYPLAVTAGAAAVLGVLYKCVRPRLPEDAHWTERARENYSSLVVLVTAVYLLQIGAAVGAVFCAGPVGCIDPIGMVLLSLLAVWLVSAAASCAHMSRAQPQRSIGKIRRGMLGDMLAYSFDNLPVLFVAALLPSRPGVEFFAVLVPGLALFAFAVAGGGVHIARWIGLARPAPERARNIVRDLAESMGHPMPTVLELEMARLLAVAYPFLNLVCFSTRMLEEMDDSQIRGVAAHEMSHLAESRSTTMKRLLASPLALVIMFIRPLLSWLGTLPTLGALLIGWSLRRRATRLTLAMEEVADRDASENDGEGGAAFARGLEQFFRDNLSPVVIGNKNPTHPELYDRLVAAGQVPDYPRPEPPSDHKKRSAYAFWSALFLIGAGAILISSLRTHSRGSEATALAAIAFTGGNARILERLGVDRIDTSRMGDAVIFLAAAEFLEPEDPAYSIRLAEALAASDRPREAEDAIDRADSKISGDFGEFGWMRSEWRMVRDRIEAGEPPRRK